MELQAHQKNVCFGVGAPPDSCAFVPVNLNADYGEENARLSSEYHTVDIKLGFFFVGSLRTR